MASAVEKSKTANTLICLLKGLVGCETTVELRNENCVRGTIRDVDSRMNITVSEATFTTPDGRQLAFDELQYIHGKNIRYVQIPDYVDVSQTIENEVGAIKKSKLAQRGTKVPKLSEAEKRLKRKKKMDDIVAEMKRNLNMDTESSVDGNK